MGISQLFNLFKKSQPPPAEPQENKSFYRSIYPESVRYAFQYKGAEMGKTEMLALLNGWIYEVVYLVTKAMAFDRGLQCRFLQDLTRLYYRTDWTDEELQNLLKTYIELVPDDATVTGTKLSQISRSGSEAWQKEWRNLIETLYEEKPDALPCLVAHTPIFAYQQFIEVYRQRKNAKLILLMPGWMEDPNEEQMGYEITLSDEPTVIIQVKDECLYGTWTCEGVDCKLKKRFCTEAIFIDDTINTSKTAGKLQSFWLTEYGLSMPIDRVRVITDLRGVESAKKREKRVR